MRFTRKKADLFIRENLNKKSNKMQPTYHFEPKIGWINDPNGLIFYKDKYHIFYQYYPYDTVWGPMHWGHAVSDDLIKFTHLPVALAPDNKLETGCFSGGAIENPKTKELVLFYTRHFVDGEVCRQTQMIATSKDGLNFKKSKYPVIGEELLPKGSSRKDFRDPNPVYVDGAYYVFIGSADENNKGQLLIYRSPDLKKFELFMTLKHRYFGAMLECPDFFTLDGKDVFIFSAYGIDEKDFKGSATMYFVGKLDFEKRTFDIECVETLEKSIEFYAPQTLFDNRNRRILLAWNEGWKPEYYLHKNNYCSNGSFTFPRVLRLKNNRIYSSPIPEIENYYGDKIDYKQGGEVAKSQIVKLKLVNEGSLRISDPNFAESFFEIGVKDNRVYLLNNTENKNKITESCSKCEKFDMTMLLDTTSVELFINDGYEVISSRIFIDAQNYVIQNLFKCEIDFARSIVNAKEI